jgi:NADP-dependent 3-hydroxy acid dehydrogenase YdfG
MNTSTARRTLYRVMVTGASAGIGRAIVCKLASHGHTLHAVARNKDKLAVLAHETGCTFDSVDIRDTARMRQIIDAVKPSVLVNNAGTSAAFGMLAATPEAITETVEVNLTATLRATRLALKHMLEAGSGQIVTIGSIAGLYPTASTVYAATKGALHRMSQSLRLELSGTGIRVTEVCPGLVDTDLLPDSFRKLTNGVKMLDPDDVADAVRYAIEAPPHVNVSTLELLPVEQAVGGVLFKPVADDRLK